MGNNSVIVVKLETLSLNSLKVKYFIMLNISLTKTVRLIIMHCSKNIKGTLYYWAWHEIN